jgi:hypothetical protein
MHGVRKGIVDLHYSVYTRKDPNVTRVRAKKPENITKEAAAIRVNEIRWVDWLNHLKLRVRICGPSQQQH